MTNHAKGFLVLMAVLLAGCAHHTATPADETAAVALRMDDLSKAIVSADKSGLEAVAWPEMSFGHANGRVENRTEFVTAIVSGKSVIPTFRLSKVKTQQVGNLAIARGTLSGTYLSAGKPVAFELGFVMLWQRRNGDWRLLAHQAHKL